MTVAGICPALANQLKSKPSWGRDNLSKDDGATLRLTHGANEFLYQILSAFDCHEFPPVPGPLCHEITDSAPPVFGRDGSAALPTVVSGERFSRRAARECLAHPSFKGNEIGLVMA